MSDYLKIIECPRDAMQGIKQFIPTESKSEYIDNLLRVGFDTIDFGSFVSPKAVPQMKDTVDVLELIDAKSSSSKLLAIIANLRGAEAAIQYEAIKYLGYPFSVSETFQKANSNKTIVESLEELIAINELAVDHDKKMVVYLSMGFGNPYGDPYNIDVVKQFAGILISLDISIISIADTVGLASAEQVGVLYSEVSKMNAKIEWGLHLHATPDNAEDKIKSALAAGCRRLDGAILGYGGCPFANDELVGNINTATIIEMANDLGLEHRLDENRFEQSEKLAGSIFN